MTLPDLTALVEAMAAAIQYEATPKDIVADVIEAAHRAGFCLVAKVDIVDAAYELENAKIFQESLATRLRQAAGEG